MWIYLRRGSLMLLMDSEGLVLSMASIFNGCSTGIAAPHGRFHWYARMVGNVFGQA